MQKVWWGADPERIAQASTVSGLTKRRQVGMGCSASRPAKRLSQLRQRLAILDLERCEECPAASAVTRVFVRRFPRQAARGGRFDSFDVIHADDEAFTNAPDPPALQESS